MKNTIEKNILIGLTVIISLNVFVSGAIVYGLQQSSKMRQWESHTEKVIVLSEEILSTFSELHAVFRAYILFKDPKQFDVFSENKKLLLEKIVQLNSSTADNPEQQRRIAELIPMIRGKIAYFETQIEGKKLGPISSYSHAFFSPQGIELTGKIRSLIYEIKNEEIRLLEIRQKSFENNIWISNLFIFSGIALNLSFIVIQYILIYKEVKRRRKAEEEVEFSNRNLKEYSEQLERSNKDLESFSYSVSHDLRAPIRGISGFSKILLEDFGAQLPEEGRRVLNIIIKNSKTMGQLIDDLLEYSRLGRKDMAFNSVDMRQMVQKVLDEVKDYYPHHKVKTVVGDLPHTEGDSALLKQLLFNLISNSYKYSKDKENPVIEISSYRTEDGRTVYFVKDNGAGFDMRYQHKLFNVFQRLHHTEQFEGTGVGLAIVKRVVEKHNGSVWGEGKPDEGACFYFTLGENK
ncbi:histidine kinase [Leptospira gomenensis]|uniref:histidine kinase n=1 Tax=Leptospira gomenensis TaxID=2484974 RepID=A0A5F1YDM7_9LEPT|nr:sensor histidine kinase [Leptospira gomenensis]TGK33793.1 histidine kinase [Leptospira gomenensis]TGK36362.1 histidine kinase [Leptospira gomenensis]TGK47386.1 histidine kinase [Leptospira gomenensis]TGK60665.1 histidine kinase [Leptospira gomenensis]